MFSDVCLLNTGQDRYPLPGQESECLLKGWRSRKKTVLFQFVCSWRTGGGGKSSQGGCTPVRPVGGEVPLDRTESTPPSPSGGKAKPASDTPLVVTQDDFLLNKHEHCKSAYSQLVRKAK